MQSLMTGLDIVNHKMEKFSVNVLYIKNQCNGKRQIPNTRRVSRETFYYSPNVINGFLVDFYLMFAEKRNAEES